MFHPVHKMTPQMPTASGDLSDLALDVYRKSASLGARLHPIVLKALVEFLRLTNSYYSNLIEGHYTHPVDIERAFKNDYAGDPAVRNRKMVPGVLPIKSETFFLLREAFLAGEFARGKAVRN